MGGPHFLVHSTISMNGVGISTWALADTGANGFLFLNRPLARTLASACDVKIQKLPYAIPVRGYQDSVRSRVNEYVRLHLTIDGRKMYNCPFIILDLGKQDCIIGLKWMSKFRILLDPTQSRFRWPSDYPPTYSAAKEMIIPHRNPHASPDTVRRIQADVARRDYAIEQDEIRRRNGARGVISLNCINISSISTPSVTGQEPVPAPTVTKRHPKTSPVFVPIRQNATWKSHLLRAYEKMNKAMSLVENPPTLSTSKVRRMPNSCRPDAAPASTMSKGLDICMISANAFHFNMKRATSEFFTTSVYEIDRVIEEKEQADEDPDTARLINEKLPREYHRYKDVFSKTDSDKLPPHRIYDHKIELEGSLPLGSSPLYRQSINELKAVKEYLVDNLRKGFIVSSNSPFSSPVLFVKKANGSLRFCIDYRKLNALTRKDAYPLPRIDELLTRVNKAKVFTKLDIRQAFHRIRVNPDSEELTAFRTSFGQYKCKVLPFGLCNGPATYQRYMNDVLMDYLNDFCMAYLDDILIYSEDPLEHATHVKKVLDRLRAAGLQADIQKSEFSVTRTKYLGHVLTNKGIEVDPDKVEPLRTWQRPRTVTGVKSFLGFCGFFRQFIRNFSLIAKPMTILSRPTEPFIWTEACEEAFQDLKQALLSIPTIHHFNPLYPTRTETDASDGIIAGVLSQQHPDEKWYPVGFYSHLLVGHEVNWEIHDKELFAIVKAFEKWRPELVSVPGPITVYTDHRSLEYFMSTKVLTAKQVRWMELLSEFHFKIVYTTGKNNLKADILSRREQDVAVQEQVKLDSRSRVLLGPERLDSRINAELAQAYIDIAVLTLAPMEPTGKKIP